MRLLSLPQLCLVSTIFVVLPSAFCAPITVPCTASGCVATIAQDPTANYGFGNPGQTSPIGYTITTTDNGTTYSVSIATSGSGALDFANIYVDTDPNVSNSSNLGFEITNDRAFIPGDPSGTYYSLTGTGITYTDTTTGGTQTIDLLIPNTFFLTDPTGIPFAETVSGEEVTVHYSQSFSYDVVGGSNNFTLPNELGGAIISAGASPVPEPATIEYLALAGIGTLSCFGRRVISRIRS